MATQLLGKPVHVHHNGVEVVYASLAASTSVNPAIKNRIMHDSHTIPGP